VTVTFDDKGIVKEAKGDPIPLDANIPEDPQVVARVKELAGPIKEAMSKVVAETAAPVDGGRATCRSGECAMGDLVADTMVERTAKQGVTIAITNGGGLRASIDAGPVTAGDIVAVLPFQNTLSTFQLAGKDIVAALENGVSQVSDGAGRFPQVAGLRFSFDRTVGPNSGRIKSVEVKAGDGWQPIEPDKLYLVASNNYMRAGGDGYAVLRDKARNAYDYGPDLAEVLTTYLQAHRPYKPYTDGRIKDATPKVVDSTKASPAPAETSASAQDASPAPTKMPDLPAGSSTLAGQPPEIAAGDAAKSEAPDTAGNAGLPELPSASATIANQPPTVPVEAKPAATEPAPSATLPAAATQPAGTTTHVIVAGDNYWKLAKTLYGEPALWPKIAKANPALHARRLPVGATLEIPAK
jgi:5'-nucleotidase